jgi:hypothetical protein
MAEEQRVWIVQCLCPQRHCIMATAGEAAGAEAAEEQIAVPLREAVADALRSQVMNPWCGICRAERATWRYETARTRFRTMDEAKPELVRVQAEQMAVAAVFGDIPRSD